MSTAFQGLLPKECSKALWQPAAKLCAAAFVYPRSYACIAAASPSDPAGAPPASKLGNIAATGPTPLLAAWNAGQLTFDVPSAPAALPATAVAAAFPSLRTVRETPSAPSRMISSSTSGARSVMLRGAREGSVRPSFEGDEQTKSWQQGLRGRATVCRFRRGHIPVRLQHLRAVPDAAAAMSRSTSGFAAGVLDAVAGAFTAAAGAFAAVAGALAAAAGAAAFAAAAFAGAPFGVAFFSVCVAGAHSSSVQSSEGLKHSSKFRQGA